MKFKLTKTSIKSMITKEPDWPTIEMDTMRKLQILYEDVKKPLIIDFSKMEIEIYDDWME